jgi:glycosyltransferase involved in cell wall biosynthesis
MTFWACRFALKEKKPYLISIRGVLSDFPQKKRNLPKKIFNLLLKNSLNNSRKVIAQSEIEKGDIQKCGFKNIAIIHNGIDKGTFSILPERGLFRKKYQIKEEDIIILFLGRINEIKGLKYLIKAIKEIKDNNIKLVIVGPDDNYCSKLLKLINQTNTKDKIILINGLYNQEKLEVLVSADIFCLPSLYDCAPNSMLEACACGLPIITTYNNGLYKIIENGAGIVINSKNSEEIRKAILYLVRNPRIRDIMGKNARDIVFSRYTWDKIANNIEKLYFNVL